ncbi:MAG: hypothetical protein DMF78_11130 [Acidobacteria bacterium]|nr:MAG: hypothetical protein DMF78_11130 [Acidobacteriota bacterium]
MRGPRLRLYAGAPARRAVRGRHAGRLRLPVHAGGVGRAALGALHVHEGPADAVALEAPAAADHGPRAGGEEPVPDRHRHPLHAPAALAAAGPRLLALGHGRAEPSARAGRRASAGEAAQPRAAGLRRAARAAPPAAAAAGRRGRGERGGGEGGGGAVRTDVREVFAVAARAYDRGNPLLAVERPETQALLPPLAGRDVLDLGSGRGHYAARAHASQAARVVALDLTPEMLEAAPRPAVVADGGRLPFASDAFDVVVASLVLSYLFDPAQAIREAARVLRPGGTIVASDHWKEWLREAGLHLETLREPAIGESLEPHFRRAGRRDFAALVGTPLLVVFRARKGGHA